MKFLPGDTYIYDSVHGHQTLVIRTAEDKWIRVPIQDGEIHDEDVYAEFEGMAIEGPPFSDSLDRQMFARRGVDILPDVLLGYADNIQF